jgi:hypothetical protein
VLAAAGGEARVAGEEAGLNVAIDVVANRHVPFAGGDRLPLG